MIHSLPWITNYVTRDAIRQCFSLVISSLVKTIAESPHSWQIILIHGNSCIILYFFNLGPVSIKKMSSYQYRKSHCWDKAILRPSYLHNGISYTGKTTSFYWIRAQVPGNELVCIERDISGCSDWRKRVKLCFNPCTQHWQLFDPCSAILYHPTPSWIFLFTKLLEN